MRWRDRSGKRVVLASVCVAVLFAAAFSGGAGAKQSTGTLNVGVFVALSGVDAVDGPIQSAGCLAAQASIDAAGGIRGEQMKCVRVDSGSDPADAVPAANQMLATTSNLVAIVGPTEVAPATEPIFARAKVVMFSLSGDPRYDHSTDPYFFRILPSDDVAGVAMAYWAFSRGLKHAAVAFDSSLGSQTVLPSLEHAYAKLGGKLSKVLILAPDQVSYQTEVEQLLASHPDGILTQTDSQPAATFFSEVSVLSSHLFPIQVTAPGLVPPYETALAKAIGKSNMQKYFSGTDISAPAPGGVASNAYKHALLSPGLGIQNPAQYETQPFTAAPYDAVVAMALAMTAAKSTVPSVYRAYITRVTGPAAKGVVEVQTYAQGVAALKQGKRIRYVGANGPLVFDRYQNAAGTFSAFGYNPNSPEAKTIGSIPATAVERLLK